LRNGSSATQLLANGQFPSQLPVFPTHKSHKWLALIALLSTKLQLFFVAVVAVVYVVIVVALGHIIVRPQCAPLALELSVIYIYIYRWPNANIKSQIYNNASD